jgi:hypothetical protein
VATAEADVSERTSAAVLAEFIRRALLMNRTARCVVSGLILFEALASAFSTTGRN